MELTVKDVAERLGVTTSTVYGYIKKGDLPFHIGISPTTGRDCKMINEEDVERFRRLTEKASDLDEFVEQLWEN